MTVTPIQIHCMCGQIVSADQHADENGRIEGIFYDCPSCKREGCVVTWDRDGTCKACVIQ